MRLRACMAVLLLAPISGCMGTEEQTPPRPHDAAAEPAPEDVSNATDPSWPPLNVTVSERNLRLALAAAGQDVTGWGNNWGLRPTENTTGYVFELEWTPSTTDPATFSLVLSYNPRSSATSSQYLVIARASGGSPLRLAIGADQFHTNESHTLSVYPGASPGGLIFEKPVRLQVSEFRERPFDPALA